MSAERPRRVRVPRMEKKVSHDMVWRRGIHFLSRGGGDVDGDGWSSRWSWFGGWRIGAGGIAFWPAEVEVDGRVVSSRCGELEDWTGAGAEASSWPVQRDDSSRFIVSWDGVSSRDRSAVSRRRGHRIEALTEVTMRRWRARKQSRAAGKGIVYLYHDGQNYYYHLYIRYRSTRIDKSCRERLHRNSCISSRVQRASDAGRTKRVRHFTLTT